MKELAQADIIRYIIATDSTKTDDGSLLLFSAVVAPEFLYEEKKVGIMMQKLRNPKNVKLISLFIAAIFVLGCFALSVTQSGVGKSAFAASSESAIGVVNYQMLVAQSPDLSKVNEAMNKEIESAQKDFNEKSKTMNEAEKRKYYTQTQERLANKQKELMDPVLKKIEASIKKIADKKGLAVVVDKNTVVFGGVDITDEVAKSMQAGK